ncbi:putative centractin [Catenaria anguillulae PL171]|uniref:Putative centractin n=1 Tax=Catenaria anguillulae PL171 TaxID=765915 RepID=A0A1Y2I780_9FUNG|nr:putative centractin [Catenaria anguillulae PL171]
MDTLQQGSGVIKAGFAGGDTPKAFFPSCVGRPKHLRIMAGAVEGNTFIGRHAQELRGLLRINYPMEHGIVDNWEDMEAIWSHLYVNELKVNPEEHPVHLTEAPLNPKRNRDHMAQIFFETFNVPAMFISMQAVLSLYASGRTTGLAIDSGDGVTHCVPVYDGFAIPHAIRRIDVAGRDITNYLQVLLRKNGYTFHTSAEREVVRVIKEKTGYVSLTPEKDEKEWAAGAFAAAALAGLPGGAAGMGGQQNKGPDEFVLPDGRVVKLGAERFKAPEVLFKPDLIGLEYPGLHQVVVDCISKTDLDLRKNLYSNLILSGGSTLFRGFGERLLKEVKHLTTAKDQRDFKIKIFAPPERKYSTWIGGSILANLQTFRQMWVTQQEYAEDPDIIHKRCFS